MFGVYPRDPFLVPFCASLVEGQFESTMCILYWIHRNSLRRCRVCTILRVVHLPCSHHPQANKGIAIHALSNGKTIPSADNRKAIHEPSNDIFSA